MQPLSGPKCSPRNHAARAGDLNVRTSLSRAEVIGDPDRLRQVVRNLLANAIRYWRPGDAIDVDVVSDDMKAIVTIADTGPGIPATELTHVFDRLWRGASGD